MAGRSCMLLKPIPQHYVVPQGYTGSPKPARGSGFLWFGFWRSSFITCGRAEKNRNYLLCSSSEPLPHVEEVKNLFHGEMSSALDLAVVLIHQPSPESFPPEGRTEKYYDRRIRRQKLSMVLSKAIEICLEKKRRPIKLC